MIKIEYLTSEQHLVYNLKIFNKGFFTDCLKISLLKVILINRIILSNTEEII